VLGEIQKEWSFNMMKLWSGPGKRTIKRKADAKNKNRPYKKTSEEGFADIGQLTQRPERPHNIIDYDTMVKVYGAYRSYNYHDEHGLEHAEDYNISAVVGSEISVNSYAHKQKNLKFLTL